MLSRSHHDEIRSHNEFRFRMSLSAAALAFVAFAFLNSDGARAETILRAAHTAATNEPYQVGLEKFKAEVEKATNGSVKVEIFPNGQLGDEGSVLKSIQAGSIGMATVANATLSDFTPELHLFNLPFLFETRDQAYKVLDGKIGQSIAAPLEGKGFVLLGYYEAGVRNILNNRKPITNLDDFKGMKIRVIPSKINIDTFRALGSNPVPLNYSELYTALQTKVVDAAEAANSNYDAKKFYEVAPYYAMVRWQILVAPLVMSKKIFDALTPAEQAAVKKAAQDSLSPERVAYQQTDDVAMKDLLAHGVKVTEPDRKPWIDAIKPVWTQWAATVGQDKIDAVVATK
jgi:tripartite ATP-independent transporter DctP family solute receptor